jgi:hypothetical protein
VRSSGEGITVRRCVSRNAGFGAFRIEGAEATIESCRIGSVVRRG